MSVELLNSNNNVIINDADFSNTDAELAIIGCILWDNKNYEKVSDFLNENHFVDETNRTIFTTIKNLLDKNIKDRLESNFKQEMQDLSYL